MSSYSILAKAIEKYRLHEESRSIVLKYAHERNYGHYEIQAELDEALYGRPSTTFPQIKVGVPRKELSDILKGCNVIALERLESEKPLGPSLDMQTVQGRLVNAILTYEEARNLARGHPGTVDLGPSGTYLVQLSKSVAAQVSEKKAKKKL